MRRLSLSLLLIFTLHRQLQSFGQTCGGTERWAVKVGTDTKANEVDLAHPVTISVHELENITRPSLPPQNDNDTRVAQEKIVYVIDAHLVKFRFEGGKDGDSDYHLVMSDDTLLFTSGGQSSPISGHSFVAEIPEPDCVPGTAGTTTPSRFKNQIADVRAKFEQQFPNLTKTDWNDANGIAVHIKGVGFFDRAHGQVGRAGSVLEIHPILDISFGTNGPVTPPVTPPSSVVPVLSNPGFESGNTSWTASPKVIANDTEEPARSGMWKAWLGGYGKTHTDKLYQDITIPSGSTTASLAFYLHISTEEENTTAYDTLKVQVRSLSGTVRKNLASFSNLQAKAGFQLRSFDLSQYIGQTIRIYFEANEDNGSRTSFILDDFKVVVQ